MADILHHFPITAPPEKVYAAISTPEGLAAWWTKRSTGRPETGAEYELWFGPEYDWRGVVSRCLPNREFELTITKADGDWQGTRVGFALDYRDSMTHVRFHHLGWPELNDHFCTSSFCWAMYLRLLKRFVETGEVIPYERRLDV